MNASVPSVLDTTCCCFSKKGSQRSRYSLRAELFRHMRPKVRGTLPPPISPNALKEWRRLLGEHGVTIESEVRWERGGTSLYFRDPDNNLIELGTPGIWPNY